MVQCVSIPRSGTHLLVRLLRKYFKRGEKRKGRIAYCEYYHCCRTRPCNLAQSYSAEKSPRFLLQKSHDEYLRHRYASSEFDDEPAIDVDNGIKHLIQIRHPSPSIISNFSLFELMQGNNSVKFTRNSGLNDWKTYSIQQLHYRKKFLEKWVLRNPWIGNDQYFFLDYDSLVAFPEDIMKKVILFLSPDENIEEARIASALNDIPIFPPKEMPGFVTPSTLATLDRLSSDIWEACKKRLAVHEENILLAGQSVRKRGRSGLPQ